MTETYEFSQMEIEDLLHNHEYEYVTIPKDWFYTVQTLESEINRELDELHKQYPNSYNKKKRPDFFEEKK